MRQLRVCDFCGDDAAGVYEPLPKAMADQRRIALCPGCRDTLEELLAPLDGGGEETPAVTIDDGPDSEEEDSEAERPRSDSDDGTDPGAGGPDLAGAESDEGESDENRSNGKESNGGTSNKGGMAGEPDGFRKVMRLLNNRSFPVERSVAVELASGAYEFSDSEVEGILEYAVERGVLEESGGELHRG